MNEALCQRTSRHHSGINIWPQGAAGDSRVTRMHGR